MFEFHLILNQHSIHQYPALSISTYSEPSSSTFRIFNDGSMFREHVDTHQCDVWCRWVVTSTCQEWWSFVFVFEKLKTKGPKFYWWKSEQLGKAVKQLLSPKSKIDELSPIFLEYIDFLEPKIADNCLQLWTSFCPLPIATRGYKIKFLIKTVYPPIVLTLFLNKWTIMPHNMGSGDKL